MRTWFVLLALGALAADAAARPMTLDRLGKAVVSAIQHQRISAYRKLAFPERRQATRKGFSDVLASLAGAGIDPSTLAVSEQDCHDRGVAMSDDQSPQLRDEGAYLGDHYGTCVIELTADTRRATLELHAGRRHGRWMLASASLVIAAPTDQN